MNGNGNSLHEGNVIDPEVARYFNWNALHQAASRGLEVVLFKELLTSKSELVDALDSQERSLLHLASANGHVEIVEALIEARPEMCLARDRDGANPLHVAAMRGKVNVLDVLFRANPLAARAKVVRGEGETILHLCVKYNQSEFLQELLKKFEGDKFVNERDHGGNTILHLAVTLQRFEIVNDILNHKKIDKNARNAAEQTAMDIQILHEKHGSKLEGVPDRNIKDLLQKVSAKRRKETIDYQWLVEKRGALIVVAVLMATMAFQAGVMPPGGVWADDSNGHKAGEAVMAYKYPNLYQYVLYSNTIGFVASLSTILLLINTELPFKHKRHLWLLVVIMCITFTSMACTLAFSVAMITPKWKKKALSHTIVAAAVVWCIVIAIVLLLAIYRWTRGKIRKRMAIGRFNYQTEPKPCRARYQVSV